MVRGECHINNCENRASILRPWLSIHRGICKDNLKLYLEAFKICRKSRTINPIKAIIEIIKNLYNNSHNILSKEQRSNIVLLNLTEPKFPENIFILLIFHETKEN